MVLDWLGKIHVLNIPGQADIYPHIYVHLRWELGRNMHSPSEYYARDNVCGVVVY